MQPTQREGVALVVAMALLGVQINVNFAERDESSNFYVRDFGRCVAVCVFVRVFMSSIFYVVEARGGANVLCVM